MRPLARLSECPAGTAGPGHVVRLPRLKQDATTLHRDREASRRRAEGRRAVKPADLRVVLGGQPGYDGLGGTAAPIIAPDTGLLIVGLGGTALFRTLIRGRWSKTPDASDVARH